jgi:hypothetical protein
LLQRGVRCVSENQKSGDQQRDREAGWVAALVIEPSPHLAEDVAKGEGRDPDLHGSSLRHIPRPAAREPHAWCAMIYVADSRDVAGAVRRSLRGGEELGASALIGL